jgi:uncharacterized repeat protein (TIGR01451 family)
MSRAARIPSSTLALALTLLVALVTLPISWPARAGEPLPVGGGASGFGPEGVPFTWQTFPIDYTADGGTLGSLSSAEAVQMVEDSFNAWVTPTSSLSFNRLGVGLGPDGDVNTVTEYNEVYLPCPSSNPVIFDSDNAILEGLFGSGTTILGFAGFCSSNTAGEILRGRALFSGRLATGTALGASRTRAIIVHEFGHMLGLGHSQINTNCQTEPATCGTGSDDAFGLPTMYPLALGRLEATDVDAQTTPSLDDIAWISWLYPNAAFDTARGTIRGNIFFSDGVTGAQGVNVIARSTVQPRRNAVSGVSGFRARAFHGNPFILLEESTRGSPDPALRGEYRIPGLPAGSYTVETESIRSQFTGGSSVGPLGRSPTQGRGEQIPMPGPAEFFNAGESNLDNPADSTTVAVAGTGDDNSGVNIILNALLDTQDAFEPNDSLATAAPITNGLHDASISPFNSGDVDFYSFTATAGATVTIEIFSRRLSPGRFLDPVIEITNSAGTRQTTCRIGVPGVSDGAFNQDCLNDDFETGAGMTFDSRLQFQPASTGTFIVSVRDALGDGRPDFLYQIQISGTGAEIGPDLIISKTHEGNFSAGLSGIYTITVTNVGTGPTTDTITVVDTLPVDFTFDSFAGGADGWACAVTDPGPPQVVTCTRSDVLSHTGTTSTVITLTITVGAGVADGEYINTVTVATAGELSTDNNSDTDPTTVGPPSGPPNDEFVNAINAVPTPFQHMVDTTLATTNEATDPSPSLACTLDDTPANNGRGKSVWYKFTAPANGTITADANGSDFDAIMQVVTGSPGSFTGVACSDEIPPTQPNVNFAATAGTTYFFMLSDFSDNGGNLVFNLNFNTADPVDADLAVTKSDDADPVEVGATVTYTITVTNNGPALATNVTVNDNFSGAPVDLPFPATPSQGTCNLPVGSSFTCALGNIASGASATVTIAVTANAAGTITNTASGSADQNDPAAGNNSAVETTTVNEAAVPEADLVVTKTDDADPVTVGSTVTYTITVTNNGPDGAANVTLSDTFTGAAVTVTSIVPSQGTCDAAPANPFSCNLGTIADSASATVTVQVTADEEGTITNTVSATSDTTDPNAGNNTNIVQTTLVQPAGPCTINFTNGGGDGLWQNAANWDLNRLPDANDTACIGGSFAVTLTGNAHEVSVLQVTSTAVFTISGGSLAIDEISASTIGAGGFTLTGGTFTGLGTLNIAGPFTWTGGTQSGAGTTNSTGGLVMSGGGTRTLNRTLINTGAASLSGGVLSIGAQGSFSTTTLNMSGGTLAGASGSIITGDINQTGGTISPGLSPGILNVVGNLVQSAAGSILLEIAGTGGPGAANGHDQANISGSADVNGTFNIVLINGFIPEIGNSFTLATRGSGPDSEPTINLPALPADRQWQQVDDDNALILTVVAAATPEADLAVTKTDDADPVQVGALVTYTITVTNNGPDTAANVTLNDTFSGAAVTIDFISPSQGSCTDPVGGAFTCNLGNIANGASATVTVEVDADAAGTITNTVSATSDTADPNAANNTNIVQTTTVVAAAGADLAVTKTDDVDPVFVGDTVTYTVTVSNLGPDEAVNVSLTDSFSGAAVTIGTVVPSQGTCTAPAGGAFTCNLGNLAASASATVTITVTAGAVGTITNTVSAASDTADPVAGNNTNIVQTTTVNPRADLAVTKTDDADPVFAGETVTYTVTVTNNGPDGAVNVTLTDAFTGASVAITSVVPSQGTCTAPAGGAFTCNLGNLANAASATVSITATTLEDGTVTNTVSAASDTNDPVPANNTNIVQTTTVNPRADLAVTKTDAPDPVTIGNTVTYTITVTNNGPSPASNVSLTDTFSGAAVTITSIVPSQGSCDAAPANPFTCALDEISSGSSATVTVQATANELGTITNTVSATADENDPNAANNTNIVQTTTVVAAQADLQVTKTDSPDPVIVGDTVTYTIGVRNDGPDGAVNITLTDTFSGAAVTIVDATTTASGGSCQISGLQVTCDLGALGDDGTTSVTIVVTANEVGTITNTAVVGSDTGDPNAANNTAVETTTVNAPAADLRVVKSASASTIAQGESVTFTIVVHNDGPNAAENVSLLDTLSGVAVTVTGRTTTQGSCVEIGGGPNTSCDLGTLAAGASATVTITATANGAGTLVNSATASSDATDPNAANNTDIQVSVTVVPPNPVPALTSINPAEVVVGGGGFNLVVTGTGFVNGSVVRVNGSDRTTTFNSATQLTAAIPASDISSAGSRQITVFNPAPGGGLSNAVTLLIADYQVAAVTQQQIVVRGQAAQFSIRVTPVAPGFSGSVTFSATGLPPATTATFNPASVTPGANPAETVLTITTTAGAVVFGPPAGGPPGAPGLPVAPVVAVWLLLAAGMGIAVRAAKPERRRAVAAMAAVVLVVAMAVGAAGCFSGGFPHEPPVTGTPPGTYPITVRATSGSLERTTQVTLVVQ